MSKENHVLDSVLLVNPLDPKENMPVKLAMFALPGFAEWLVEGLQLAKWCTRCCAMLGYQIWGYTQLTCHCACESCCLA